MNFKKNSGQLMKRIIEHCSREHIPVALFQSCITVKFVKTFFGCFFVPCFLLRLSEI